MQAGLRDVVKDILDSLTPREAKVLRMRFGIEMSTDHTLEEVGKQFDVTRERIRQIGAPTWTTSDWRDASSDRQGLRQADRCQLRHSNDLGPGL